MTGCTAEALQALWSEAQELEVAVAAAAAKASSDAVRVAAAKFLEQAVLLLTADLVPAVAGISAAAVPLAPSNLVTSKAALVRDAEAALGSDCQPGEAGCNRSSEGRARHLFWFADHHCNQSCGRHCTAAASVHGPSAAGAFWPWQILASCWMRQQAPRMHRTAVMQPVRHAAVWPV